MSIKVRVLIYDTCGVDDEKIQEFSSLKDALEYVFDSLEDEEVELQRTPEGFSFYSDDVEFLIEED